MTLDPYLSKLANATLLVPFPGANPPGWVLEGLEQGLGGVTLFAINGNVPGATELAALTEKLRNTTRNPIVAIDEEGGDVTRLAHETGSPYPGSAALGIVDDLELTHRVHRSLGAELRAVGVSLDFAPSADVNTADDNPIIGTRAFGSDPALVARHTAAAVTGLQDAGVTACAKHFPGHGATSQDSHLEIPTIDADLDLLDERELTPFRAAIAAGTKSIMTGHLRIPSLTGDEPATLSRVAVTGLLRERLGYRGAIISDALDMHAASGSLGIPEAAVRALAAGVDLLCLGAKEYEDSVRAVREAIVNAVAARRLPGERLEQAADLSQRLRAWTPATGSAAPDRGTGLEGARRAIQITGSVHSLVSPMIVEVQSPRNIAMGPVPWGLAPWAGDITPVDSENTDVRPLLARATGRSLVIVVRDAHRYPGHRRLVSELVDGHPGAVLVEMGLPVWHPVGAAYVATYGATRANGQAAAEVLGLIR